MLTSTPSAGPSLRLLPVGAASWRVTAATGRVLGHVERIADPDERFRARRFHVPTSSFVELGTFWSVDEAVACVRWS